MKHLLVIALFASAAPAAVQPTVKENSVSAHQRPVLFPIISWGYHAIAYSQPNNTVHYHVETNSETDVVKIQIERYHMFGGWQLVKELAAGSSPYDYFDPTVVPGETYKYRARGVNSTMDYSTYSPEDSISIPL